MKIAKDVFLDFLNKVGVKGINNDCVIEKEGMITTSAENALIIVGQTKVVFPERVALTNLGLLAKIVGDIAAPDINIEIVDNKLNIFTTDNETKYSFRLPEPKVVESLHDDRSKILVLKDELAMVKIDAGIVKRVRAAISSLIGSSSTEDKISVFVESGKLFIVVIHEGTGSVASIEVGKFEGKDFRLAFPSKIFSRVLDVVGDAGVSMYAGQGSALFFELISKDFTYMISFLDGASNK